VFVTYPPEPEKVETAADSLVVEPSTVPTAESEASLDQELEGIDLAELDSILDQNHSFEEEISSPSLAEEDLGMVVGDDAVAELDEADLDLDFTIEPEGEPQQEEQLQAEQTDLDIDDLDLDMDFELDDGLDDQEALSVGDAEVHPSEPELDSVSDAIISEEDLALELDQMDYSLDEDEPLSESESVSPESVSEDAEGEDFKLFDADIDVGDDRSEVVELETEALDRELELSLKEDKAPFLEPEASAPAGEESEAKDADDLDLSDLDAVLGLDDASDQAALDMPEISDDEDLELSLDDTPDSESDELIDPELDEAPALELDEEPALELDDDAEPILELESDDESIDSMTDEGDDLDLSDLDAMLEDAPEGPDSSDMAVEETDLELEMERDDSATQDEGDLEDLSFELDSEFEDETAVEETVTANAAAPTKEDEELDLSDIEQMLEGDEVALTADTATESADGEKWAADGEVEIDDSDELDLADIESAIDAADSDAEDSLDIDDEELTLSDDTSEKASDTELELDELELELETKPAADQKELPSDDDSKELDLSDLSDLVDDQDVSATSETIDTGEIELEFEVSDEPVQQVAKSTESIEAAASRTGDMKPDFAIEDTMPAQLSMEMEADEMPAPVKKKRSSKGLIFILILVLLGGAGYLFYSVSYMGLEIPYLSDYLNPKPKDPAGILNLATLDINSKFIENKKSGRLFVVTGKVRNGKDTARKMIRLQGKLYTKGKVLAKTEFTYAGIRLKDQEISELPIADIKQRINKVSGPITSIKTLPGQSAPFMIVFSDLPDGLDEFAIEVISSSEAQ
jgi:pilus assembly protein FimV